MDIKKYIVERKKTRDILIMTHQIFGYPDFSTNEKAIELFSNSGVDLVELQIPFSDPMADGPLFCKSNQIAIDNGVTVSSCFEFVEKMCSKYTMKFLIMTYYNIIYQYGVEKFVDKCARVGIKGLIVPDAPIDDAKDFYEICKLKCVDAIAIATPYTDEKRLKEISDISGDFIYFVPRKGVTGTKTAFDTEIINRVKYVKTITKKSVAVGFGIQNADDILRLKGSADIAIIGSKIQSVIEEHRLSGLETFLNDIFAKLDGGIKL